jgi:hypothetical protein
MPELLDTGGSLGFCMAGALFSGWLDEKGERDTRVEGVRSAVHG